MSSDLVISDLCIRCFQNKGHAGPICPSCHFNEQHYKGHPLFLKPRSALKGYYWIGNPLGQGGFGITYLGLDRWLQKKVAIKEYLPSALATRDFLTAMVIPMKPQETAFYQGLQLFIDEARNLAKFDHLHIVRVTHFFEENQTAYMVMDYLEGNNAEAIVNQADQLMAVESALAIVLPILEALHTIHQQHLYHRDISLQNIRILTDGTPVLIDFGAARHIVGTQSHSLDLVLKQGYSPLEQYSGKGKIGPWTDIYACSAVLYTLLTGQLPPPSPDRFCGDSLIPLSTLRPEIPENIQKAVMQALSIQPEERFQTVTAFIDALTSDSSSPITDLTLTSIPNPKTIPLPSNLYFIPLLLGLLTTALYSPPLSLFPLTQLLAQAHNARNNAHYEQAYQTYHYILQHWPLEPTAQRELNQLLDDIYQRAQQTYQTQQWTSSLEWTQLGLKIKPEDARLNALQTHNNAQLAQQAHTQQLQKAAHHSQIGQLEEAYNLYQQVLQDNPQHSTAQQGLAQLAQQYQQRAETDPTWLSTALHRFPTHAGLRNLHKQQQTQHWITQQFKKAQQQLLALRLTEPSGDNAYQTYQTILNTLPNHPEAQQGLFKIAEEYLKLAQIKRDDIQKNLELIDKGLRIVPTHSGLHALRNQLLAESQLIPKSSPPITTIQPLLSPPIPTKVPVPNQTSADPKITIPPNPPTTPAISTTPSPKPTATLKDDPISKLLATADYFLQTGQFDKATQAYHNILLIVPAHSPAQQQLQYIANYYRQLAQQYYQQQQFTDGLSTIQKGLLANPNNQDLLTLREQLQQAQHQATLQNNPPPKKEESEKNPNNPLFTPSF